MSAPKSNNLIKLILGVLISIVFLYLAFGKINFTQMLDSFKQANYWLFIPAALATIFAHWLRGLRWRFFLNSIKSVPVLSLFSATLIGYMGNTILPAHLGELFRANVIGNRENIPTSSVLATLVIERIIDVLSLLVIMVMSLLFYPFPEWVTKSGYIMFGLTIGLFVFLLMLKQENNRALALVKWGLKFLPEGMANKIEEIIHAFIKGINGMERKRDYLIVFLLSLFIWFFYWLNLHIVMISFNLVEQYHVNAVSSLVLLVITTIAVVVPSSPGYVGTYHYLCQVSLGLFGVPSSIGLSFAFVAHGLSILPTAILGLLAAWKEGISRLKVEQQ